MSAGHEAVKADMVAHLTTHLPAWSALTAVNGWPAAPNLIAASDVLPVDEDKPWPLVLVSATSLTTHRQPSPSDPLFIGDYTLRLTVGVRSPKSHDQAVAGRDRLILAVRWLLQSHPALSSTSRALTDGLTETTDPVALDTKGRPVALGTVSVVVRHTETTPDPAAVEVTEAAVEIDASDAAETGTVTVPTPPPPSE